MSVDKKIKTVEREDEYMPALVSADSGKVIKLYRDYTAAEEASLSNKDQVYLAWADGEEDVDTLHQLVDEAVKQTTIRNWLSKWGKYKGLPRIAKD